MNETLSSVEFNSTITASEALEAVQNEGAIAIHNFLPAQKLWRAATFLMNTPMRLDDNEVADVHRRQQLAEYGYTHGKPWAPQIAGIEMPSEPVFKAAQAIDEFITSAPEARWKPNRILAHRYELGDYINAHRDHSRDALGYVAVLTVGGSQVFGFERDNGEKAELLMQPGTLTLMRGFQRGSAKQRPRHWVEPASERRLAVSLREARIGW